MIAIVHEGKSIDPSFFKLLLDDLGLDKSIVRFYGMGSKSNFFKIEHLNYRDISIAIEDIDKILFILDSDYLAKNRVYDGFENTLKKIESIQQELNIVDKCDTCITYDPNSETKEGYLESLILSTISKEQKKCIEAFLDCSDFKSKGHHKSILNQIYKSAYPNAPYDFSHSNFDELKKKLTDLFKENNE